MHRRVPPLAIAIALVAAGLVATAWSTRRTVDDAFEAVNDGEAFAVLQIVRADLAELDAPPSDAELDTIVREHSAQGLRYLAISDMRGRSSASAALPSAHTSEAAARTCTSITSVTACASRCGWHFGVRGAAGAARS